MLISNGWIYQWSHWRRNSEEETYGKSEETSQCLILILYVSL